MISPGGRVGQSNVGLRNVIGRRIRRRSEPVILIFKAAFSARSHPSQARLHRHLPDSLLHAEHSQVLYFAACPMQPITTQMSRTSPKEAILSPLFFLLCG